MSVSIDMYIGWTITLCENLTNEKYEFFNKLEEEHPEYSEWKHVRETTNVQSKVRLVVDGMSGEYARLIYITKHVEDIDYVDDAPYTELSGELEPPKEVYQELNKAYQLLFGENNWLDEKQVKLAMWYHWY